MTTTVRELSDLPRSERRAALQTLVVEQFKACLLMTADEELPLEESYFELGFTSLRITEIKQDLEALLGCGISTSMLFNKPTVAALLDYLADEVFSELVGERRDEPDAAAASPDSASRSLWDDALAELYQL